MEFEELAPGIIVYKNVIDDPDRIVVELERAQTDSLKLKWQAAKSYTDGKSEILLDHRDTYQVHIPHIQNLRMNNSEILKGEDENKNILSISSIFNNSFLKCEEHYKGKFFAVTNTHEPYAILKYGIGQKFNSHVDDHPDFTRRISTVYYFNEDYSGGEIVFKNFNISYKPKRNELLIFPSSYVYMHSVLPVTEGTRYAVVSWLA